jgi:hypothetical protein
MQTVTRIDTVSTALARSRAAIYRDVKHKLLPLLFLSETGPLAGLRLKSSLFKRLVALENPKLKLSS